MRLTNLIVILAVSCQLSVVSCFAQATQDLQKSAEKQNEEKNTWDFGDVKQGDILEHAFVFKNEFAKTIIIKGVNTSCGCTTSEVKKKTLMPDESTEISVKFNTKGYVGQAVKHIFLNIDDVDNPVIKFIIKANVIKQADREVK
jgi:hypothetical protein